MHSGKTKGSTKRIKGISERVNENLNENENISHLMIKVIYNKNIYIEIGINVKVCDSNEYYSPCSLF